VGALQQSIQYIDHQGQFVTFIRIVALDEVSSVSVIAGPIGAAAGLRNFVTSECCDLSRWTKDGRTHLPRKIRRSKRGRLSEIRSVFVVCRRDFITPEQQVDKSPECL